jgi:hypothetical protein
MSGLRQPVGVVDDHAVATAEDTTGDRRRHVHPVVAFGAQTVELRSRLMAGGGSWTGSQQRRPHLREPRQRSCEHHIHASMRTLPTLRSDLVLGVLTRDSAIDELASGHCATLPVDDLGDGRRNRTVPLIHLPMLRCTGNVRPALPSGLWTAGQAFTARAPVIMSTLLPPGAAKST